MHFLGYNKHMRLIVLITVLLAGCVTVTVQAPSKAADNLPLFPSPGRTPAAEGNLLVVRFSQSFCINQNFYFKAETSPGNVQNNKNCLVITEEEMNSTVPVQVSFGGKQPAGNFADVVLERALKYDDKSFKEMATSTQREYEIRSGQCGSKLFFVVNLASKKLPDLDPRTNAAAAYCRFDQPEKVLSYWPLAGVYPRVYGEPVQNLKAKLGLRGI